MTKLPVNEIQIIDRQRIDLGDVPALAASIKTLGLIQPIVVNQEKRLIAGRRRLAAVTSLGWTDVPVVYKETLSEDQLQELELEEDIRRKDRSWQEKVIAIAKIHWLKAKANNWNWGNVRTAELLNLDTCTVSVALRVAKKLREELDENNKPKPDARFWPLESPMQAINLILRDKEDEAVAELARQEAAATIDVNGVDQLGGPAAVVEGDSAPAVVDDDMTELERLEFEHAKERYESNPLNTIPFEEYWRERKLEEAKRASQGVIIPLSKRLFHGDGLAFMNSNPGMFDAVITDTPYAIDMDNLNQQHPRGGMTDVDTVEAEHDVKDNMEFLAQFFPAAFRCTKEKAYVITWCDQMLWQFLYDCAIKAGFVVQRWPITWVKTSQCMNQCAQYNYTKTTEIAIVCRKPGTTLAHDEQSCVVTCGKDELCERLQHKFAKPFEVWKKCYDPTTLAGQLILDPCCGRGSGIISGLMMQRNVYGVELQENHYNHLLENVKQYYLSKTPNAKFT